MAKKRPRDLEAERLAKKFGVSEQTIRRDANFAHAVNAMRPKEKAKTLAGESGRTQQEIADSNPRYCATCTRLGPAPDCKKCPVPDRS